METVKVQIDYDADMRKEFGMPAYATTGSVGIDLRTKHDLIIGPRMWHLVRTGMRIALPDGYEAQIRSRSGLALKKAVIVLNAPGTIDTDYRDEIGVILYNADSEAFFAQRGDRIAQMVFAPVARVEWSESTPEAQSETRLGGFGSTGVK